MSLLSGIYTVLRWSLGTVFITAGGFKLLEPGSFAVLIGSYGLLPEWMLMPAAVSLAVLEATAGVGLLFDLKGSLAVIAVLLVLFIAILGYGIHMGLDVDCGCFGPEDPEAGAYHGLRTSLYRDLIMLAGVGLLYAWRRWRSVEPLPVSAIFDR